MRRMKMLAGMALLALAATSCGSGSRPGISREAAATRAPAVTVGAFNFAESQVLASVFADVLGDAGVSAAVRTLTTREVVQPALWKGSVQLVPEYTASLTAFLRSQDDVVDVTARWTLAELRVRAQKRGLEVLEPSRAADQNGFAVTRAFATQHGVRTLSDLATYRGGVVLGGPAECRTRPYCLAGLEKTYGIRVTGFVELDPGGPLTKLALQTGHVQLGLVFTSAPGLEAYGLTLLVDDKHLQDADLVVPVLRSSAATATVRAALDRLTARLTTADLVRMNAAVELRHEDPSAVARAYVTALHLR